MKFDWAGWQIIAKSNDMYSAWFYFGTIQNEDGRKYFAIILGPLFITLF